MLTPTAAIVTGASSGLGLEAARQLSERGVADIVVTARTDAKAQQAAAHLVALTGREVFHPLALDLNDHAGVRAAAASLRDSGRTFHYLLLNAGLIAPQGLQVTADGVELTSAASLTGHHVLLAALLESGLLSSSARIVIAGSEAARGDVPMMKVTDIAELAQRQYEGDRVAAADALLRGVRRDGFKSADVYADTKAMTAMWAAAVSERLPDSMTIMAISPGSTPATDAGRNMNAIMKFVMSTVMGRVGKPFGLAHGIDVGAARYFHPLDVDTSRSGAFLASRPGKMTGQLVEVDLAHINDPLTQSAVLEAVESLTGSDYPVAPLSA